jgi:hypothetical protein
MTFGAAGALVLGVLGGMTASFAKGPDPTGPAASGLCQAWKSGSTSGLTHKHEHSQAMKNLAAAAAARHEGVAAFCAAVTSEVMTSVPLILVIPPTTTGPHGASADVHGNSASANATTNADSRGDAHSSAGSTNATNGQDHRH